MKYVSLKALREAAAHRPAGYIEACLHVGKVQGGLIAFDDADYELIRKSYRGLGDRVHDALEPTVKLIDKVLGTDLAHCGGCKRRQEKLNQLGRVLTSR